MLQWAIPQEEFSYQIFYILNNIFKILNISLVTKMIKKLYLYAYSIQKRVYEEEIFTK